MKRIKHTKIFSIAVVSTCLAYSMLISSACRSSKVSAIDPQDKVEVAMSAMDLSRELFEQVNRLRVSKGMSSLQWSDEIAELALAHAQTMAHHKRLSHDGFDARSEQLRKSGLVSRLTENVAYGMGHKAPALITIEGWNKSSEHRRNMLDERATLTGVGCALTTDGFFYVVQLYGR